MLLKKLEFHDFLKIFGVHCPAKLEDPMRKATLSLTLLMTSFIFLATSCHEVEETIANVVVHYAAAAPYVAIDMNPAGDALAAKDAVFISPHKLVGGPGTPGILVVKRQLMTNAVPAMPGGGTVLYVNPQDHTFIADPQRREEGGTPAIVEAIRAGFRFLYKF